MKPLSKKAKIVIGAGVAIGVVLLARKAMATSPSASLTASGGGASPGPAVHPAYQPVPPMIVPDYSPPPANPFGETGSGGGTASGPAGATLGYDSGAGYSGGSATSEVFSN